MRRLAAVFVGGALGSWARYGVGLALAHSELPAATWTVNVVGSFLLTAISELALSTTLLGPTLRMGLGVGALGGFTTYATFNLEILGLVQRGQFGPAAIYALATAGACLAGGLAGLALVRRAVARRQ